MFLKKCASKVGEVRKKGRRGHKRPAMHLGDCAGKNARGNLPELPNTTCMVVIRRVPNGNNDQTSSIQLQASYTDVRHWEELINFIKRNRGQKEPYCLTVIYKCDLMEEELDEEYMGLYAPGQMMNDPLYGQISFNGSISNAVKLKLGQDVKLFFIEMQAATGKDIAEHVIRPAKVIPARMVTVSYALLLISRLRFRGYPMEVKERWMRRQVGTTLTVVLM